MTSPLHLLFINFFLSLAIISTSDPTAAPSQATTTASPAKQPQQGPSLIEQTCKKTSHPELCIQALSAVPMAHRSDQRQLAAIVLRLAYQNGTETSGYITGLMDQVGESEPNTQQCLSDCIEEYELALQELDDASAALDDMVVDKQADAHAVLWIQTAIANIKTCQDGCKEGAEHKNVLTKRNGAISKLCSITISIIKSLG